MRQITALFVLGMLVAAAFGAYQKLDDYPSEVQRALISRAREVYPRLKSDESARLVVDAMIHQMIHVNKSMAEGKLGKSAVAAPSFGCTPYGPSTSKPTSVHQLLPGDIDVVMAMGDSLTAAFGAGAGSIFSVFTEYRGMSWSIGGDNTVAKTFTLPNILKNYNPNVKGFSLGTGKTNNPNSKLNVAVTGAVAQDLLSQAKELVKRLQSDASYNIKTSWKMLTLFIGANNLCDVCTDPAYNGPDAVQAAIEAALDYVKANVPRVFVNLVPAVDCSQPHPRAMQLAACSATLIPGRPGAWLPASCSTLRCRARPRTIGVITRAAGGEQGPPPPAPPPPPPAEEQSGELQGAADKSLQLPPDVIQQLRTTVFSFDTFFVTSVENYQADGVLFKGNLRGDPAEAYAKLTQRLKAELGDQYKLYLLENQEEKPVAVVLPLASVLPQFGPLPEPALAALLGLTTVATTLNINGAELFNAALLTVGWDPAAVSEALPGTAAFLAILALHELGHWQAAGKRGVELAPSLFIPAGLGLLGSFGAITRIKSFVPDRTTLAAVSAAGPLWGAAASLPLMLVGAALSAQGIGGVELDVNSFRESLLAGSLGQAAFGGQLFASDAVSVNPLFVAGWAGLIINAINCLPAGELDGGRTFLGLFGRRAASRMGAVTLLLLGLAGFTNSLALFWLLLVLTLQRGPVTPCDEELSPIKDRGVKAAAIAALLLPLLVLLPYPAAVSFTGGLPDLPPTF